MGDRARPPVGVLLFLARAGLAENRAITALLVLAVSAGVAFQIANTANLDGYHAELVDQAVTNGYGQVRVLPKRGTRFEAAPVLRAISDPEVEAAVPLLGLPGAIGNSKDGAFRNALVIGVDGHATRKPFVVASGTPLVPGDDRGVLVGSSLAQRLGITAGTEVELRVVTGVARSDDDGVAKMTMVVRGTASGTFVAPEAVFIERGVLAGELGDRDPATMIAIYLHDGADADEVGTRLARALPDHVVRTWREDSTFASSAIASSSALASLSRWMVGFAVIVPVWALLYIHVLHRRRAIAVINALGIGRASLFAIYLLQALLVGLAGIAIGGALGYVATRWFEAYPIFRMDVFEVRPVVTAGTFLWPMLLVLVFTLAASVIPALRAARVDPASILRGRT